MGLFGKRKQEKIEKKNMEDINNIINGTPNSKKVDKKANSDKYILANEQQAQLKKDELCEKLADLRRACLRTPGLEDNEETIQALISKVNSGTNNSNSNIQFAVDSFIIKKLDECFNYCSRESALGLLLTLEDVKALIFDRNDKSSDLSKYTIKEYIQTKVQFDKYNIEKQIKQSEIKEVANTIDKLKAYGNDPLHKNEVQAVIARIKNLKESIELKNKNINDLDKLTEQLNKVLSSIERNINLQEIPGYNTTETIMNTVTNNEISSNHIEEVMEAGKELDSSLRDNNVSSKDITVGESFNNETSTSVDSYQDSLDELNSL